MKARTHRQIQIIDVASRILTSEGISGLTTKKLASQMGFSEAAIYRHFSSKEDVIVSMLHYLSESMEERFSQMELLEDDPAYNFEELFRSQFEFFKERNHFVIAVFSDGLFEKSERVSEGITQVMETKKKFLMPIITSGKQKQVFTSDVSTQEMMHIVMGAVRLQMYNWRRSGFEFDITIRGNTTIQSLLKLITAK
jgi:AcrR family transcriptional regulator